MTVSKFISEGKIQAKVVTLAKEINEYYKNEEIVVLAILKGSFMFCSDLVRHLNMPVEVEFISVSSYGDGMESGNMKIELDVRKSIKGKRVLLVEDIIDTGNSLYKNIQMLMDKQPKSLDVVTMLSKPSRREKDIRVRFTGFEIPDEFVVGYGMDYAEKYRNLPFIGIFNSP